MTNAHQPRVSATPRRWIAMAAPTLLLLLASGCAAIKDGYPGAAEAQQRTAAEAADTNAASSNVDTQATYLRLVEQMQRDGLWFASLAHIDALEQRWGASPESHRLRADALRNTGQAAASEAFYKRLLGTPLESAGFRGLGLAAGARGDYAEAVQLLKQAQRRNPTDSALLSDLGYASLRAGMIADARLPLMQALQLKPDSTQAQANLALYLEVTQQREQAAALMDAHRMSATTRAGIREAARQFNVPAAPVGAAPTAGLVASGSTAISEDSARPLALKASRWSGAARGTSISAASPSSPNPPLAAAAPLPVTDTPQGTP